VAEVPEGVVTVMSTVAGLGFWGGEMAVRELSEFTVKKVAATVPK
jgi:hypothetical protein